MAITTTTAVNTAKAIVGAVIVSVKSISTYIIVIAFENPLFICSSIDYRDIYIYIFIFGIIYHCILKIYKDIRNN
jgi:hypothetical protein